MEVAVVLNWFEELKPPSAQVTRQIHWLRFFVEGVVIVAGIAVGATWAAERYP